MENIIQELVEYSGKLFIIKEDNSLRIPAFSIIEYDFRNNPNKTYASHICDDSRMKY